MFGAMLMRLAPLLEFSLWGSDWGEYYHLTDRLVRDGFHAEENLGWGRAYVDFPGLFDLTGAVAVGTGIGTADSMLLVIPCVTGISCLLVACIVLRLKGGPWAALIAGLTLAVILPVVFTNSHPVPGPIGSVLVMGIMLVFIMGDSWRRDEGVDAERPMVLYILLLLMMFVLTVTHHMSHLFLILVLGMAYLTRMALVFGREPERDFFGLWSLTASLALATVYWLVVADTFREEVMVDLAGVPGYVMMGLTWVALVVLIAIGMALRRYRKKVPALPFWGTRELGPALFFYFVIACSILFLVVLTGFPGTDIDPGEDLVVYAMPPIFVFALLMGTTDVVLRRQGGHTVVAWVVALTGSFLVMVLFQNQILVPYRHVPYITEAAAVLIGIGSVHLMVMFKRDKISWRVYLAPVALMGVLLVASLAYTAYPPKDVMGNFQEGTSESELGAALWLQGGLPCPGALPEDLSAGCVVTDHRLSSTTFGIGGQMATWDEGGPVLHGGRDDATWAALNRMSTPNGKRPVTAVVLSDDLRTGAALSQFNTPSPIEGEAWDKFFEPPFLRIYDSGDVYVLYVVHPLDTTG
jgi:hypothetical protein